MRVLRVKLSFHLSFWTWRHHNMETKPLSDKILQTGTCLKITSNHLSHMHKANYNNKDEEVLRYWRCHSGWPTDKFRKSLRWSQSAALHCGCFRPNQELWWLLQVCVAVWVWTHLQMQINFFILPHNTVMFSCVSSKTDSASTFHCSGAVSLF